MYTILLQNNTRCHSHQHVTLNIIFCNLKTHWRVLKSISAYPKWNKSIIHYHTLFVKRKISTLVLVNNQKFIWGRPVMVATTWGEGIGQISWNVIRRYGGSELKYLEVNELTSNHQHKTDGHIIKFICRAHETF